MERLTVKSVLGGWTLRVPRQEAVDRLAAYEDTELEPEDIATIKAVYEPDHVELKAYRASGLTPDELPRAAELVKAEKEGRCVMLPCKINDIVCEIYRRIGGEDSIRPIQFWWSDIPRLGKTVFLTYAEAEAAL